MLLIAALILGERLANKGQPMGDNLWVYEASIEEKSGDLIPVDINGVTGPPLCSYELLCQIGGWVQSTVRYNAPQSRVAAKHCCYRPYWNQYDVGGFIDEGDLWSLAALTLTRLFCLTITSQSVNGSFCLLLNATFLCNLHKNYKIQLYLCKFRLIYSISKCLLSTV